ncbi:MAG: alpha-ketoacid dehydrogenase subunit beta [Chloroflexota bacterium]|nr:alpha-ketoacid dehydrogenase subunit beta [Chloroflexota bacterium]
MTAEATTEARQLPYILAITEGVRQSLQEYDTSFLAGEDVGLAGSVFRIYKGLYAEFGPERVIDSPISESGLIGLGVGSAATGLRPMIDIMFSDFIGECMDEIANQLAKTRYMFGGKITLPVTVLTMGGGGINLAAQHSQSLEAWLCHIPGLKVMMPATPHDVKGAIIAANRDENPVFVIMNKASLGITGEVPEEPYAVNIGEAIVRREGSNFTIVAIGRMMHEAMTAAEMLEKDGIDVEVIDPLTLQPLDTETILTSVRKTHRALVVHEAVRFGGVGAEIAAQIQENAFDDLDAPVGRIGAPFSPVPFSPPLEQAYLPNAQKIADGVKDLIGLD